MHALSVSLYNELRTIILDCSHCKHSANMKVVNKSQNLAKLDLKKLILQNFTKDNGKFFYSIEVTPKENLSIDFNDFKVLPIFVDITWIRNENLRVASLQNAPAFELARKIECTNVVNSVTCYKLTDENVADVLNQFESMKNFTILRGGKIS